MKILSITSIILFGILTVWDKFIDSTAFNTIIEARNILVLIYLFTSLKYYQMEVKDKNSLIQELRTKLGEA